MKKAVKYSLYGMGAVILLLLFLLITPVIFKDKFAEVVQATANKSLKTQLKFEELNVSFFRHFPHLTITLSQFSLRSSPPFASDTLVSAKEVSFGVDLFSLFKNPIRINRVYLNRATFKVLYNEKGEESFDVFLPSDSTATETASSGANMKIEDITIIKSTFIYSDASLPMRIIAHGINYRGKSDITQDIMKLKSKVEIDSLDFNYDGIDYLSSKPVHGDLSTSINLKTTELRFEKNDMKILDIPVKFQGQFLLRPDGYDFYISLISSYQKERVNAMLRIIGTNKLWIVSRVQADMNLGNWMKGLGIDGLDLRGKLKVSLEAEGIYESGQNPKSDKPDTVILSIPEFKFKADYSQGYLKYKTYPEALTDISLAVNAQCEGNDYHTISASIDQINVELLKNKIQGYIKIKNLTDFPIDAKITTSVNLAELKQALPIDSISLAGNLDLALEMNGNYAPEKKLFPVSTIHLNVKDGVVQTTYYPHPIEQINVHATITNTSGKLADTRIQLAPFSFLFEGKPMHVEADLQNPDNLRYNIKSRGYVDLGKVYQVFAQEGLDVKGHISTNLALKGIQSDALAGNYQKLMNSGHLELHDLTFHSEYLPLPFYLKKGVFRFENDNIWFEHFEGEYGRSDITLDGHVSNVINYILSDQTLKGTFHMKSTYLATDELITTDSIAPDSSNVVSTSVFEVPKNLEIGLKLQAKKVNYSKMDFTDFSSTVEIKKGMVLLKGMNFDFIGCKVNMDATYGTIHSQRAFFDFHVVATDFDIKRAYQEVEMFKTLSSSAANCEGIVSIDYTLKGKLDGEMNPIYPSLEGGGTITLKKVKVMGMKLFTSMSKNLEKEKIKNPDLSKVELKTTIKNNVITLEKTKMKISGFRFRISGETNFNGAINFKARLGLPPLGIVGIPIRILGTQDNPKFKYGRGNNDEDVEETGYTDELPPDMLEKIKNAKEEDIQDDDK